MAKNRQNKVDPREVDAAYGGRPPSLIGDIAKRSQSDLLLKNYLKSQEGKKRLSNAITLKATKARVGQLAWADQVDVMRSVVREDLGVEFSRKDMSKFLRRNPQELQQSERMLEALQQFDAPPSETEAARISRLPQADDAAEIASRDATLNRAFERGSKAPPDWVKRLKDPNPVDGSQPLRPPPKQPPPLGRGRPVPPAGGGKKWPGLPKFRMGAGGGILRSLTSGKAAIGLGVAGMVLPGLVRGAKDLMDGDGEREQEILRLERMVRAADAVASQRDMRRQELIGRNMQMAAQVYPQMTASIMAGRELPEDAVAMGGKKRVDLLRALAEQMSSGKSSNVTVPSMLYDEMRQ